jgi:hypothetical protein
MEDSMAASDNKNILAASEANWQAEMKGFHTYTALSKSEATRIVGMWCEVWRWLRSITPIHQLRKICPEF